MIWPVALAIGAVVAAGTYLALSRDVVRCLVGLAILGAGINLLVFASGRLSSTVPPIVPEGAVRLTAAADPLPQALVLTAIVIGFALLCFSLVLAVRLVAASGTDDVNRLHAAEPSDASEAPAADGGHP